MSDALPVLWVLTTTFPRWNGDAQPPFVLELSRRLSAHFSVVVLAPRTRGAAEDEVMDGVRVRRYPYFWRRFESLAYDGGVLAGLRRRPWRVVLVPCLLLGLWLALRRLRRTHAPDVVHAHWLFPQGWVAALALRGKGVPLVTTSHGADLFALRGPVWDALNRRTLAAASCVTVVSSDMADTLRRRGFAHPRIEVAPMGVDLQHVFTPDETVVRSSSQLLFVGRLVPKKGCDLLLQALALLSGRRPPPRFLVAGDGPERRRLERLVVQLGLCDVVQFLGRVANHELPSLYRQSTAFVAPFVVGPDGDREGLGLVVVEAMGCECPVITTELARINEAVSDDSALIAEATPKGLAQAIEDLVLDPGKARARARRARQEVIARFDWPNVVDRYVDILTWARRQAQRSNA